MLLHGDPDFHKSIFSIVFKIRRSRFHSAGDIPLVERPIVGARFVRIVHVDAEQALGLLIRQHQQRLIQAFRLESRSVGGDRLATLASLIYRVEQIARRTAFLATGVPELPSAV